MSTSNSYDFTATRDTIIYGALRLAGVIAQGETPTASQISDAATSLNYMIKAWEADGMPLWAITNYAITPVAGQAVYTLNNPKPLKILQAFNRDITSSVDIPMRVITRQEYNMLGNKSTTGNPIQVWFNPDRDATTVTMFPTPDANAATQRTIYVVCQRPYQDFDSATDTPDFPQEWYEAVKYGLAMRLAGDYNIDIETRKMLQAEATAVKQQALNFGLEDGSLYFQRDTRNW
jgi:hypothetical protein